MKIPRILLAAGASGSGKTLITCGLLQALEVLKDIPEIAIIRLSQSAVVRHDLVQTVVKAYEAYERNRGC